MDNTIYIDTTIKEDSSISTHSSNSNNTSMSPVLIDTDHPDAIPAPIEINTDHPAAMYVRGIRPKIQNTNTHEDFSIHKLSDEDLNFINQMPAEEFDRRRAAVEHPANATFKDVLKGIIQGRDSEDQPSNIVTNVAHSAVDAAKGVYGIATGQIDPHSPEAIKSITDVAGNVILGGGGLSSAMGTDATHGAFLTYGRASGLNKDNMLKAISMKEAGATEQEIFKATGAEHYEGKWGERVPYTGLQLKTTEIKGTQTLQDIVEDHAVFKADPSLKSIPVRHMTQEEEVLAPGTHGFTDRDATFIAIKTGLTKEQFREAVVHETEHVVQKEHGLPGGSSAEAFKDASYYSLENRYNQQSRTVTNKLHKELVNNSDFHLPESVGEDVVPLLSTIAVKAKYAPHMLTEEDKLIYKDIQKHGLTADLESLRMVQNAMNLKMRQYAENYKNTKGEVGARVAEDELKWAPQGESYKQAMELKVPEGKRVNSPLDPGGIQASQDFGSVYRYQGHYLNPDQAKRLYTAKPELRPVPPGFSKEHIQGLDAKQYLGLVDYLKKDSTYLAWRRSGDTSEYFSMNPQIKALYKKLKIEGSNDNKNIGSLQTLQSQKDLEKMTPEEFKQYMEDKEARFKKSMITPTE